MCAADGLRARSIPVDYAAHSPQVQEIREALLEGCAGIVAQSSDVSFYSSVSGVTMDCAGLDADYWYRNLRDTVEFEQATGALLQAGLRTFVEISPHPVLTHAIADTLEGLVKGGRRHRRDPARLERFFEQVRGRGACRHPDGAVRLVASALDVFADDVTAHLVGRCRATPKGRRRG